jgi:osmoprotectant transport system permease protein
MVLLVSFAAAPLSADPIRIASKTFGESYLLSEIVAQLLEARGFEVRRQFGLGGTLICYGALIGDEIDLYIEYTGTLAQAVLKSSETLSIDALNEKLAEIEMLQPFGFNNTYVIAMRAEHAQRLGINAIGDLRDHPDLKIVVSHEFLERFDGWPGMSARYNLTARPQGIEHALAYQAIEDGAIDVTDAYSTDGELLRYDLRALNDDLDFFPEYLAAPLVRRDLDPRVRAVLDELAGTLDANQMSALNNAVAASDFANVANGFLRERGLVAGTTAVRSHFWQDLSRNTLRHLELTLTALLASIFAGVGLGVAIYKDPRISRVVIYVCGLLQTIPSIALLALMIPLLGIGKVPAIVALFLYALLPILRNTVVSLSTIDPELVRTATAIGLSSRERLRHVLVPMALPNIFAGIRTAAVISVGTATLAAFIGAGGLGDPIVTGLSLNDTNLILQGAIPAAGLAILIELLFERLERVLIPAPLRAS